MNMMMKMRPSTEKTTADQLAELFYSRWGTWISIALTSGASTYEEAEDVLHDTLIYLISVGAPAHGALVRTAVKRRASNKARGHRANPIQAIEDISERRQRALMLQADPDDHARDLESIDYYESALKRLENRFSVDEIALFRALYHEGRGGVYQAAEIVGINKNTAWSVVRRIRLYLVEIGYDEK